MAVSASGCTITGTMVTATGAGARAVTASQPGDANSLPALAADLGVSTGALRR